MRIRHLRYFMAVAEELNFTRASVRVHIEPSSLSHAVHEMESQLGVRLINRTQGSLQLTWPGEVLLEETRRMLSFFENAQSRVQAASQGLCGRIRLGLADSLAQPPLTRLLARSREEDPGTEIRIMEMTTSEMLRALHHDQIDIGITLDDERQNGYIKYKVWSERPAVVIPTHHPLLSVRTVALQNAIQNRLILCHPEKCSGGYKVISRWFSSKNLPLPDIAEYVSGHEQMIMLVAAGYGIGIGLASQLALYAHPDVIVRPMQDDVPDTSTFFVLLERDPEPAIARFLHRAGEMNHFSQSQ
ncbi:LysR family transcriptional regulator [Sodalis sp. RH22]|uniref:LysR family transcriptional regulator n=1 Tax=unclassified Sodalis (in: enterobacteria) TaxID=2636512 RepID=UPI0039B36871